MHVQDIGEAACSGKQHQGRILYSSKYTTAIRCCYFLKSKNPSSGYQTRPSDDIQVCSIPSTNGSYTSQSSCGKLSTKKRLIETSNLPTTELKHKRLFVVMDMSIQHKKQKKEVNKNTSNTNVMRHSLILSHSSKQYHDTSITSSPAAAWQHRVSRSQNKLLCPSVADGTEEINTGTCLLDDEEAGTAGMPVPSKYLCVSCSPSAVTTSERKAAHLAKKNLKYT